MSFIRKRFTYANVAMTLALVFAMTGGAYAAKHYLITSTKQISPKVLKQLKGKTGAVGAQGPVGPAGKDGAIGSAGKDGATGSQGPVGPSGKEGPAGKEGKEGKEGSPWTAGGTLPSGKTETGEWALPHNQRESIVVQGENPVEKVEVTPSTIMYPYALSFNIPLSEAPDGVNFNEPETTNCPGTAEAPSAAPGQLCVYMDTGRGLAYWTVFAEAYPSMVSKDGVTIPFEVEYNGWGFGTWAVTAK